MLLDGLRYLTHYVFHLREVSVQALRRTRGLYDALAVVSLVVLVCATGAAAQDTDGDGVVDPTDNCPYTANADQADADGDGVGDVCDNCVDAPNPGQEDLDLDRVGDACDPCTDVDGDGFGDPGFPQNACAPDNCPAKYNPDQRDSDSDGVGDACFICLTLGALPVYSAVVQSTLTAKLTAVYGYAWFGTEFFGTACVGRARIRGARFIDHESRGHIVATSNVGTAIRFTDTPPYAYTTNEVDGDIVTGGGAVSGNSTLEYLGGTVDTTGAHPELAHCRDAMTNARRVSARFASLPPTQVLGDVHVGPGERVDITGAPGEVIQVGSLTVSGGAAGQDCTNFSFTKPPGVLNISGDSMVVNVNGKLQFGNCAEISSSTDVVLNVVGTGPSVRVGKKNFPPAILATDRTLIVKGTSNNDGTFVPHAWVAKLVVDGLTFMFEYDQLCSR